jgi:hypothetical protein
VLEGTAAAPACALEAAEAAEDAEDAEDAAEPAATELVEPPPMRLRPYPPAASTRTPAAGASTRRATSRKSQCLWGRGLLAR